MNKKLLTVAIAGAMAAPMTADAVKYKLSGQVNRAVVFLDDGEQSDVRNVDNIASGTRFRLRGSEDMGNGMKVGFYWELQTSSSAASGQTPDQDGDGTNGITSGSAIRQANIWFSGNWGKLTIGQQDGAANGAVEADLSGTAIAGTYSGRTSFTGGVNWRTSLGGCINSTGGLVAAADGGGAAPCAGSATGGTFHSSFDGFSRYDAVRYDSPALGPVTLSASVGNDALWEVAARLDTALGGGQLSAALFYSEASGPQNVDSRYGGSASYLFSQGTNISVAYAENEPDGATNDQTTWSAKIGHKWGPHAVSIGYGEAEDLGARGFEDTGWNVGYVHDLKKVNTELYASFFHQELDVPANTAAAAAGGVEDINAFVVGARIKFD